MFALGFFSKRAHRTLRKEVPPTPMSCLVMSTSQHFLNHCRTVHSLTLLQISLRWYGFASLVLIEFKLVKQNYALTS